MPGPLSRRGGARREHEAILAYIPPSSIGSTAAARRALPPHRLLKDWLLKHTLLEDRRYMPWLARPPSNRLLKKAHLRRWRARAALRRTRRYASRLASRAALHLDLLSSLPKSEFFGILLIEPRR